MTVTAPCACAANGMVITIAAAEIPNRNRVLIFPTPYASGSDLAPTNSNRTACDTMLPVVQNGVVATGTVSR